VNARALSEVYYSRIGIELNPIIPHKNVIVFCSDVQPIIYRRIQEQGNIYRFFPDSRIQAEPRLQFPLRASIQSLNFKLKSFYKYKKIFDDEFLNSLFVVSLEKSLCLQ